MLWEDEGKEGTRLEATLLDALDIDILIAQL
jgi:hypothetical protein